MRKILLTCGLLFTTLHFTNAQCTPDPGITEPGIYPDTIQNLPPAFESAAYSSSLQIRVLTDTTVTREMLWFLILLLIVWLAYLRVSVILAILQIVLFGRW